MESKWRGWCKDKCSILAFTGRTWCGACRPLEPEWSKLKQVNGIDVHFCQFDTDDAAIFEGKKMVDMFDIRSFPTILVFDPKRRKFYQIQGVPRQADKLIHCANKIRQENITFQEFPVSNPTLFQTCDHNGRCVNY